MNLPKQIKPGSELNLAPLIDCFTVLLTYLLVSTSFVSLGVLDAGILVSEPSAQGDSTARFEVELQATGQIFVRVTGPSPRAAIVPAIDGLSWDTVALRETIEDLRRQVLNLREIAVSADSDVPYAAVVRAIETLKRSLPNVYLEG